MSDSLVAKLRQYQLDFLGQVARLEERTDDGKRKIDVVEGFVNEVMEKAKPALLEMQRQRITFWLGCHDGAGGYKPEILQAGVKERCKNDPVFFFTQCLMIYNPWLTKYEIPMSIPFVLFKKQEEYILWRQDLYMKNKTGLVYKCRDAGVSWLNAGDQFRHWLFDEGFQGRFGSQKETKVDDRGNPDSIFWKIRHMLYNTPKWFRPSGFMDKFNKFDNVLKIINNDNGSVIGGDGGDNMGTGGRASLYDCDEWATVEHDKAIKANLSANSNCIIYTSTPKGMDNDYAEEYRTARFPQFSFDYWDDPRKTEDWFKNFSETHDHVIVMQEVLKRFDAYSTGAAIPSEWYSASVTLWNLIKAGKFPYDPPDRIGGLDVAAGGKNRSVMVWRRGIFVEDAIEWNISMQHELVDQAGSYAEQNAIDTLSYDPIGVGVGVRSEFDRRNYTFNSIPVDVRNAASEVPLPGDTKPARERCANRRAELICRLRKRFENTFEFITKHIEHTMDEMIACPNHPKLRAQISLPQLLSEHGRWRLESKEAMVKRGVESPDYFDALNICFAEERIEKSVLPAYRRNEKENEEVPWQIINPKTTAHNYISINHEAGQTAGVIAAIWWFGMKKLQVYGESLQYNATVGKMASAINSMSPARVYMFVGNREMFGNKQEEDALWIEYLEHNMMVQVNIQYNEMSAIAKIEEMLESGRLQIMKSCSQLRGQLADWVRTKGGTDKSGSALVIALCSLVNHLQNQNVFQEQPKPIRGYAPPPKKGKENLEWMKR